MLLSNDIIYLLWKGIPQPQVQKYADYTSGPPLLTAIQKSFVYNPF